MRRACCQLLYVPCRCYGSGMSWATGYPVAKNKWPVRHLQNEGGPKSNHNESMANGFNPDAKWWFRNWGYLRGVPSIGNPSVLGLFSGSPIFVNPQIPVQAVFQANPVQLKSRCNSPARVSRTQVLAIFVSFKSNATGHWHTVAQIVWLNLRRDVGFVLVFLSAWTMDAKKNTEGLVPHGRG